MKFLKNDFRPQKGPKKHWGQRDFKPTPHRNGSHIRKKINKNKEFWKNDVRPQKGPKKRWGKRASRPPQKWGPFR